MVKYVKIPFYSLCNAYLHRVSNLASSFSFIVLFLFIFFSSLIGLDLNLSGKKGIRSLFNVEINFLTDDLIHRFARLQRS